MTSRKKEAFQIATEKNYTLIGKMRLDVIKNYNEFDGLYNHCASKNNHIQKWKDIDDLKMNLRGFVAFYKEIRPHQHLKYLTPMRYYSYWKEIQKN